MAGKGPSRRPEQVAEAIRTIVATALVEGEVRDPRVGLVTVSSVEVTRDLSLATIMVVPHGEDTATLDAAVEGLQSAAGYLRRKVAQQLTTRLVPELRFVRDRGMEHARRINEILAGLHREEDPS
jgi:ribosome-binding factor A